MIDFYTYRTPNTRKVGIMLKECALPYEVRVIDIAESKQSAPAFLAISPDNRVPAIVGHEASGEPRSFFEPVSLRRTAALQWLFWQVGSLGPMVGQAHHFLPCAPESRGDGIDRYVAECARLCSFGVSQTRFSHGPAAYCAADPG